MDRRWLAQYPPGVPADVDLGEFSSLKDILEKSCAKYRDRPAYSNMGATLRYADLDRLSARFGAYLQHVAGLAKGDRIAIMLPNVLQYPVALFGALRAGAVAVNVNPLYTARELEHQLVDSGARAIVILENFAHTLERVLERTAVEHVIVTRLGDLLPAPKGALVNFAVRHVKKMVPPFRLEGHRSFRAALAEGGRHALEEVALGHDDIAILQYTGGTTGVAKGAILTHGNMVANLQQSSAWLAPVLEEGEETIVTALPLYHIFSLTANCLVFMKMGGENLLITNPRDFRGFLRTLARTRFTVMTGVNTLFNALLNTPGFERVDWSHLKLTLGGGMAVARSVAGRWNKATGCPLLEAYGLTETSPGVCINPLTLTEYTGSIGVPIPSTEVAIMNEAGEPLPPGQVGELCVRGPQVMRGYWNRPEETAAVMFGEWFRTGDMARMDERGFVYIEDRKKDMINVSGFNVYPNEVESVALAHEGVLEAACVGVPDERSGEIVKLFVVKKDPAMTAEALVAHCREQLTAYKVPKQIEFRESLPKTNVGKILRRALREEAAGKR